MSSFVVRIWLPDRPGALGQVASGIGAIGGDVVGIEILERGGGTAIDELVVALPDGVGRERLLAEIAHVEGVAIEDVRSIDAQRPDAATLALQIGAELVEAAPESRLEVLCCRLIHLVDGDWAVAMRDDGGEVLVARGDVPDVGWLAAFLAGSRHLVPADAGSSVPADVVWATLTTPGISVAAGRGDRPFHARERLQVALLGRIADRLCPGAPERL